MKKGLMIGLIILVIMVSIMVMIILLSLRSSSSSTNKNNTTNKTTVIDRTKPIITILDEVLFVELNSEYDLLTGVQAIDDVDGDITHQIVVNDSVDKLTLGEYIITYRVTDKAGNIGVGSRVVHVVNTYNIQNTNQLVVSSDRVNITKGEIFQLLKQSIGLEGLLNLVDRDLFSEYQDQINLEKIQNEISKDQTKPDFYTNLEKKGIIRGEQETETEFLQKVTEFYELNEMRRLAIVEYQKSTYTNEQIIYMKQQFKEDACYIILHYENRFEEYKSDLSMFKSLSETSLFQTFQELYLTDKGYKIERDSYTPYLDSIFTCDYQRVRSREYYIDTGFMYNLNIVPLNYFQNHYVDLTHQYIIYKVSVAPSKSTYDQELFEEDLKNDYAFRNNRVVDKTLLKEIRKQKGLVIYDDTLNKQYDPKVDTPSIEEPYVIAKYLDKTIGSDELYQEIKGREIKTIIEFIDHQLLESIDGIHIEEEELQAELEKVKREYSSRYYYEYTWEEFLMYKYKVKTEDELSTHLYYELLKKNYILGDTNFIGVDSYDLNEVIESWFKLYVLEFKLGIEEPLIEIVLRQLKEGASPGEESRIHYKGDPFIGFNHLNEEELLQFNVNYLSFKDGYSNPILHIFTSVEEHEYRDEFIKFLNQKMYTFQTIQKDGKYNLLLLIHQSISPEKPAHYDELSPSELEDIVTNNKDLEVVNYYYFIKEVKAKMAEIKLEANQVTMHLSNLRETSVLTFHDSILEDTYRYQHKELININE